MAKKTSRPKTPARPGRPPGAPNKLYVPVEEIPPACVKCGSTELVQVKGSKVIERSIAGTLRSGFAYNRVRHTRKRCECGQVLIVRSYFNADEEPAAAET